MAPWPLSRSVVAAVAAAALVVLGALQVAASVALRDAAQPGSWPRAVPPAVALSIDRFDPARPMPATLRLVLARDALARGDLAFAASEAAALPHSRDRLALEGELADARGDQSGAVRAFLAAGDLSGLERHIASAAAAGRYPQAVALQSAVVARLQGEATQADALAQAFFDLGGMEETMAYRLAVGSAARHDRERLAGVAYGRALALAPLDERYLIAFGNQELNLDDLAAARRAFERAHDADPTRAEPFAGLGDAAFSADDVPAARAYLARARALDPQNDAVRNLARELGE